MTFIFDKDFDMLKKVLLASVAFVFIPSIVFASDISCPAIYTVQQSGLKLNSADKVGAASYRVYSSHVAFRESNLPWYVSANNIEATTSSDALAAGRTLLYRTSIRKNDKAMKDGHYFYCYYGSGEIVVSSGYVV